MYTHYEVTIKTSSKQPLPYLKYRPIKQHLLFYLFSDILLICKFDGSDSQQLDPPPEDALGSSLDLVRVIKWSDNSELPQLSPTWRMSAQP